MRHCLLRARLMQCGLYLALYRFCLPLAPHVLARQLRSCCKSTRSVTALSPPESRSAAAASMSRSLVFIGAAPRAQSPGTRLDAHSLSDEQAALNPSTTLLRVVRRKRPSTT